MRISDWSSDVCSSDLPDRSALDARILWTREFDPAVLSVLAEPGLPGDPDSIDLSALNLPCIAAVAAPQLLHVVLGDGMRRLRLDMRSEEHTSELQSLMRISYAVFCLKKQQKPQ